MSTQKKERNKRLLKLRATNPQKWTWGTLAKEFNISRPTAYNIYKREKQGKVLVGS